VDGLKGLGEALAETVNGVFSGVESVASFEVTARESPTPPNPPTPA